MFSVTVDLERGCFETTVLGFWTLETVGDFWRALTEACQQIERATGRPPVGLCDYTGAMIQSQDVVNALTTMMENPTVRSRRVAMYTGGVMARMQAARATRNRPECRFFADKDEARAWLFAADSATEAEPVRP